MGRHLPQFYCTCTNSRHACTARDVVAAGHRGGARPCHHGDMFGLSPTGSADTDAADLAGCCADEGVAFHCLVFIT